MNEHSEIPRQNGKVKEIAEYNKGSTYLCTCQRVAKGTNKIRGRRAVCHVPESVEHCVLHCSRYDAARQQCAASLGLLGVNLNLETALGHVKATSSVCRQVLVTTGGFLLAIDGVRRL